MQCFNVEKRRFIQLSALVKKLILCMYIFWSVPSSSQDSLKTLRLLPSKMRKLRGMFPNAIAAEILIAWAGIVYT